MYKCVSQSIGALTVGGSKGRPTGLELRACQLDNKKQLVEPCTPARPNLKIMIKTNDWWYQKGNNNSTSLIHTTGGSLGAIKRRT